jgi:hypothetical protein
LTQGIATAIVVGVNRIQQHQQQAMRLGRLALSARLHSYLGNGPARGGPGS